MRQIYIWTEKYLVHDHTINDAKEKVYLLISITSTCYNSLFMNQKKIFN